ncbi:MAG: hypothetical protein RJQ09_00370 [Cyclobacteriaceae bacterium]
MAKNKPVWLVYHFKQTRLDLVELLDAASVAMETEGYSSENGVKLVAGNDISKIPNSADKIIAAELHPFRAKSDMITETWHLEVFTSLDTPFFKLIAGERLIPMMEKMGLNEDELIQHSMVTRAIENAQKKAEGMVSNEKEADSIEEWVEKNIKD